jgi:hypothetical protein
MKGGSEIDLVIWNDLAQINEGDYLKYKNDQYEIINISTDVDYGGISRTFTIKTNNERKKVIVNYLGDVSGHFGSFYLKNKELQLVKRNT